MKILKLSFPAFLCFCLAQGLNAQESSTDTTKKKTKPQFKLSLNYNTGLNYYGRTDSLKSSGFFPLAELWITPKIYVNAAPIFVNNAVQKFEYAGSVATVGYQNVTKKWITGLYVSKPIYKESSELVQSALKAQSGANVSFLNKFINLNIGADVKFSDKTDFGATGGLDHLIRIENKDNSVLVFDPGVYIYGGSQNFQRSYYKKNNTGFLNFPAGNGQLVTEEVSNFSILAYELTMPVVYAKKSWMFVATPSYIMPQNLLDVPNRPDLSERGENMFYATLTTKYTF
ncbi:MAG: hypothetical protein JWR72_3291 [Flavisolibacter sp.]|jgi:hypothetical protein|nr:hypothetical protein [Flavisolibacter sp.]